MNKIFILFILFLTFPVTPQAKNDLELNLFGKVQYITKIDSTHSRFKLVDYPLIININPPRDGLSKEINKSFDEQKAVHIVVKREVFSPAKWILVSVKK